MSTLGKLQPFSEGETGKSNEWMVLQVGTRKEKAVMKVLSGAGIRTFVPLKERHYHYPSKSVVRHLPILPGYVFAVLDKQTAKIALRNPFVFRLLKTGDRYATVPEAELSHLNRLSSTKHLEWCDAPTEEEELNQGDLVEILHGPLAGIKGRFQARKGKNVFLIGFGVGLSTQLGTFEVKPEHVTPVNEI